MTTSQSAIAENLVATFFPQINTGGIGFYRTLYTEDMLHELLPGIKNQSMPPRDRLGLENDLFALVTL